MNTTTQRLPTVKQVISKYKRNKCGHFFDNETMDWFGDTPSSFVVVSRNGNMYLKRSRSVFVNVFGSRKQVSSDLATFGGVWQIDETTGQLSQVEDKLSFYHESEG